MYGSAIACVLQCRGQRGRRTGTESCCRGPVLTRSCTAAVEAARLLEGRVDAEGRDNGTNRGLFSASGQRLTRKACSVLEVGRGIAQRLYGIYLRTDNSTKAQASAYHGRLYNEEYAVLFAQLPWSTNREIPVLYRRLRCYRQAYPKRLGCTRRMCCPFIVLRCSSWQVSLPDGVIIPPFRCIPTPTRINAQPNASSHSTYLFLSASVSVSRLCPSSAS